MSELQLGGVTVDREAALDHARLYLTQGEGWAYPSYDSYDAEHAAGPLVDADLLAPILLNVNRVSIKTYQAMQGARPRLQAVLDQVPVELSLVNAAQEHLELLGEMFAVLDGPGIAGARGTVLSKLLHRKRPAFIPLYDEQVRRVYQDGPDAPVPSESGRSWAQFAVRFSSAVQADLRRERNLWEGIADLAPTHPVTPLRALDIVAWWAGRREGEEVSET